MLFKSKQVRLATEAESYRKLKISKNNIEFKEDALRTSGKEGSYEWWYTDAKMDDGTTVVIVFYTKDRFDVSGSSCPTVIFELTYPDGTKYELVSQEDKGKIINASKEKCDVQINNSFLKYEDGKYFLHFESDNIVYDAVMTNILPPWRPETGHAFFGDNDEHYFAWFVAQPSAKVESTLLIDGKKTFFKGIGYHDHNWGNIGMQKLINHWYWGRAKVGEYNIIACDIIPTKKYGNKRLPIFMIAKDGEIIADDSSNVRVLRKETIEHPYTHKFMDNHLIYDYPISSNESYKVEFIRKEDIISVNLLESLDPKLARIAKFFKANPTYSRILGKVRLTHNIDGKKEVFESDGLWEQMFFSSNKHATISE